MIDWMKGISKKNEVITIYDKGVCIGFIVRSNVLFGWTEISCMGWSACMDLKDPEWVRGFEKRKDAVEYLKRKMR